MAGLSSGFGPLPPMVVAASGFGAGTRDLDGRPNLTQVVIGAPVEASPGSGQPVVLLEANLDDVTGEVLGHAVSALLAAGAHDAWVTPVVMKKGRPAHTLSALVDPALVDDLVAMFVAETGTMGVRGTRLERWPVARTEGRVDVDGRSIRMKVGPGRAKPEFDDVAKAAERTGRPVRSVLVEAEAAWTAEGPSVPLDEPMVEPDDDVSVRPGGTVTSIREHVEEPLRPFDHHHHQDDEPPVGRGGQDGPDGSPA